MGGPNSGRRGGGPTVEGTAAIVLDANRLLRVMDGRTAARLPLAATRRGAPFLIIVDVALGDDGEGTMEVRHASTRRQLDGDFKLEDFWDAEVYTVSLEAVPCRLGGRRWFFLCPLSWRRCAKLYLPEGARQFRSRQVHGLSYHSQRIDRSKAAERRLARLYGKLGGSYRNPCTPVPPRPKGMRQRTYARLRAELEGELAALRPVWEASEWKSVERDLDESARTRAFFDRVARKFVPGYEPDHAADEAAADAFARLRARVEQRPPGRPPTTPR